MRKRHVVLAAASIGVMTLGMARQAFATSYASGVSLSGTSLTFDINESINGTDAPAGSSNGSVTLYYNGTSQILGALPAGIQTITLSATPTTAVQIAVTTNDPNGWATANSAGAGGSVALEIDKPGISGSPDYGSDPYGIAVNTYPSSPYFGRVYLANYGTNPGLGIYIENADGSFQGVAPGTAEASGFESPFNAGIPYSGADGPYNIQVGSDGYLYVGDWSDGSGGIYREKEAAVVGTGSNVSGGLIDGENVLAGYGEPNNEGYPAGNHDDINSEVVISGSSATGNLQVYAVDSHYGLNANPQLGNQLYEWNVGNTTLTPVAANNTSLSSLVDGYNGAPTPIENQNATYLGLDTRFWSPASLPTIGPGDAMETFPTITPVTTNMARGGPDNQFYITQSRTDSQQPGLFVLSPTNDGNVIWDSLDETFRQQLPANFGVDFILDAYCVQASPDGRFLAVGQGVGAIYVTTSVAADYGVEVMPLLAGIPDLNLMQVVLTSNGSGSDRQIAFDAADNIYTTNAGNANQAVWGPGGTTTTVTGTNGTFANGGQWNADANGNLSATSNWVAANLPNGTNESLTFGAVTTAQRTVTIDTGITTGSITFSSPNGYVLSGSNTITMNGLGVNFNAQAGANTINAPVSIQADVGFFAASGASLTITRTSANITSLPTVNNPAMVSYVGSPDVVKNGPGTVTVDNLNLVNGGSTTNPANANLDIYQGKLALAENSGPAVVTELSIYNQYGASLDLANNDLIYDYNLNSYTTTSPESVVQALVASGAILTSTGGIAAGTGLAVAENNATFFPHGPTVADPNVGPFTGTYDGQNINAESSTGGTVIVKYTYYGDLNFDGKVDSADLALMGIDGPTTTMGWVAGDLNYDGKVNSDDWSLYFLGAAAYNAHGAINQAPEPASLALIGLAAIPMIRRRRRA